jgi:hypothetical protein
MRALSPVLLVAGENETAIRSMQRGAGRTHAARGGDVQPGLGHGWLARKPDLHVQMVEAWLTGQEPPPQLRPEIPSPATVRRLLRELGEHPADEHLD